MITAIELENFRGFSKPVRIELAPVTLLFGTNSSGKTALLHAILFLHEVFVSKKESPETSVLGGRYVNFGNFSDLVFSGDQNRSIRIKVEMSFDWEDRGSDWGYRYDTGEFQPKDTVATVAVDVVFRNINNRCRISAYTFFAGDSPIVQVDFGDDVRGDVAMREWGLTSANITIFGDNCVCPEDDDWDTLTFGVQLEDKIADGGSFLELQPNIANNLSEAQSKFFSGWVIGISHQLIHHLTELVALGPLREVPVDYVSRYQHDPSRVSTGLSAWDELVQLTPVELEPYNKWLGPTGLDLGYQLKSVGFAPLEAEQPTIEDSSRLNVRWDKIQNQRTGDVNRRVRGEVFLVPIYVKNENFADLWLRPCAVGVGVSQIVPVIYHSIKAVGPAILAKRVLLIEQPELHLHPRAQTRLGDMFIVGFIEGIRSSGEDSRGRFISDKQVIIETHSEHLILRMLRRIRETTNQSLPSAFLELKPEQVSVYYLQTSGDGIRATRLRIDETGEFIDRWPNGFFDDRAEELF